MARISNDPLKQFTALKASMQAERARIVARLAELDQALGVISASAAPAPVVAAVKAVKGPKVKAGKVAKVAGKPGRPAGKPAGKRVKNELSLKEAVIKVLTAGPLSKEQILAAVDKLGYQFNAGKPINSLNTLLYGSKKPKFKNTDGAFSVAK